MQRPRPARHPRLSATRGGRNTYSPAARRPAAQTATATRSALAIRPRRTQRGDDALADAVGLLQVGIAREDELVDPELVVLGDAVGDLLVAADQRGAGAAADEADPGPQVGGDLQRVGRPPWSSVIRRWPSDCEERWTAWEAAICSSERPASSRSASCQASSDVSRAIACRRMPKRSSRPSSAARSRTRPIFSATACGRLAPGQVHVGVGGADLDRGIRGAAEEQLGPHRMADDLGIGDLVVLAVEVDRLLLPQPAHDRQELAGPGVAIVLARWSPNRRCSRSSPPVTTLSSSRPPETRWKVAAICAASVGEVKPGTEGDEEAEALGDLAERRRHHPGVLAPAAGRRQRGVEAELLGRARDLSQVADVRRAVVAGVADPAAAYADGVAEAEIGARVAVGGQEPVQLDGHRRLLAVGVRERPARSSRARESPRTEASDRYAPA